LTGPELQIPDRTAGHRRNVSEVFHAFLKLGLTSFGGPIAHIGYFRKEFVEQRQWVNDAQFAQLLAICQLLPGPASSQLGFCLGLKKAGWTGALAAFVAFTLPSALLLFLFALIAPQLSGPIGQALVHGLKLVALVVVAHGVLGMTGKLCTDARRRLIAVFVAVLMVVIGGVWLQVSVIVLGALLGFFLLRDGKDFPESAVSLNYGRKTGWALLTCFLVLLVCLPLLGFGSNSCLEFFSAFYRAGALVFGGGHVVLPFLEQALVDPGWLSRDDFMAGYGAAQAVPGPMFSLSAYLGVHLPAGCGGLPGAGLALAAIFLPGFLLVSAVLPLWHTLATHPAASRSIAGINASVVGILTAALYDPVWVSAVDTTFDIIIAMIGFICLSVWRLSPLIVVLWCVLASILAASLL
jgi:chromate transporter